MSIVFYSFLAALATIIGGGAASFAQNNISQRQLSLLIAFSVGLLLSMGINHMAIESIAIFGRWVMAALSFGFIFIYGYDSFLSREVL
ncbi:MAG: hypothetical protein ACI9IL_000784 [Rickettsiales bacterium]|jgi:hypothetical protein